MLCQRHGFRRIELSDGWFPYLHVQSYKLLRDGFPFLPEGLRKRVVGLERKRRGNYSEI